MSTVLLYQYPPKSSIGVFTFFQNPGQGLVKKSPFCPGFQAIGPGLPGRKTAAPKGRPHGKPSVAFGPHPPRCVGRPLKEGRPACVRPPCAGTNGAKCNAPLLGTGSRQLRKSRGTHIPRRYRCSCQNMPGGGARAVVPLGAATGLAPSRCPALPGCRLRRALPVELFPHVEESAYLVFVGVLLHACIGLPAEQYPQMWERTFI